MYKTIEHSLNIHPIYFIAAPKKIFFIQTKKKNKSTSTETRNYNISLNMNINIRGFITTE